MQFQSKGRRWRSPPCSGSGNSVLFRPSTDCTGPTSIMENNLLSSRSTGSVVNLIQKHPHRSIQNNV